MSFILRFCFKRAARFAACSIHRARCVRKEAEEEEAEMLLRAKVSVRENFLSHFGILMNNVSI